MALLGSPNRLYLAIGGGTKTNISFEIRDVSAAYTLSQASTDASMNPTPTSILDFWGYDIGGLTVNKPDTVVRSVVTECTEHTITWNDGTTSSATYEIQWNKNGAAYQTISGAGAIATGVETYSHTGFTVLENDTVRYRIQGSKAGENDSGWVYSIEYTIATCA